MKTTAFWPGALAALLLSLIGSSLLMILLPIMGYGLTTRIVISLLAVGYVLHLMRLHRVTTGKVALLAVLLAGNVLLWLTNPTFIVWLVVQVGLIWLTRCLFVHSHLLAALSDLLLNGMALLAALVTAFHTQSIGLSLWSFFLLQANTLGVKGSY